MDIDTNDFARLIPDQRAKIVADLGLHELVARDTARTELADATAAHQTAAQTHAAAERKHDTDLAQLNEQFNTTAAKLKAPLDAATAGLALAEAAQAQAEAELKRAEAALKRADAKGRSK